MYEHLDEQFELKLDTLDTRVAGIVASPAVAGAHARSMLTALLFSHPQASELDSAGVAEALALALLSPQQLPVGVARDFERHARAAELPLATRLDVLTSALSALGFGRRPPQPTPPGRA